jgi:hypothetical protein
VPTHAFGKQIKYFAFSHQQVGIIQINEMKELFGGKPFSLNHFYCFERRLGFSSWRFGILGCLGLLFCFQFQLFSFEKIVRKILEDDIKELLYIDLVLETESLDLEQSELRLSFHLIIFI